MFYKDNVSDFRLVSQVPPQLRAGIVSAIAGHARAEAADPHQEGTLTNEGVSAYIDILVSSGVQ